MHDAEELVEKELAAYDEGYEADTSDRGDSLHSVVWAIVLSCFVLVLVITNPSPDDFEQWVYSQTIIAGQGSDLSRVLTVALDIDRIAARSLSRLAYRRDYVLFSTFRVRFDDDELLFVGVLNNFLLLSGSG